MSQEKLPSSVYRRRRIVAGVSAAVLAVGASAAVESATGSSASSNSGKEEVVYPRRTENQLRALPNQAIVRAHTGEGVDGLIVAANPGLLDSTVPGSEKLILELEDVVGSEAPNGEVQDGDQYSVPEVPTAVEQVK